MNNLQPTSNREPWIDFAKGITLLLVIIGHTVSGVLSGQYILSICLSSLSSAESQQSYLHQHSSFQIRHSVVSGALCFHFF